MAPKNSKATRTYEHHDYLHDMLILDDAKEKVNDSYDELFVVDKNKSHHLFVCCFCDEIVVHPNNRIWILVDHVKKNRDLFQWSNVVLPKDRMIHIESTYVLADTLNVLKGENQWLTTMALSPRGLIMKLSSRQKPKMSCCTTCASAIRNQFTPLWAIVNYNFVGKPPTCLTDLTEVEFAIVTPVHGHGCCFTYSGGGEQNLKGCMSFMRVQERKLSSAVMHLEAMGLSDNIVILVTGKMTKNQVKIVENKIRPSKLISAVEWLCHYNKNWQHVNLTEIRNKVMSYKPVVLNRYSEVESSNTTIENRELFTCYFPDGATNSSQGGFDDMECFKSFVERKQKEGFDVRAQVELTKEFVQGKETDHLTNACLLQFPYGIGGLNERRRMKDGSRSKSVDTLDYLSHLSRHSDPVFHKELFCLISYSMASKARLLKKSSFVLRGKVSASTIARGVNCDDVTSTIRNRRRGDHQSGTAASKKLLNAVDACSRALPHSKEAAKIARGTGESMQHHFGMPSVFLTVVFDDENSYLMQKLSNDEIDDDKKISQLSDDELAVRVKRRVLLRRIYPGLTGLNFEMQFYIVMNDIVGWDMRTNKKTKTPGYFGTCFAVSIAFEEQGRKTIHAHMCLWIEGFRTMQNDMYFESSVEKRENAKRAVLQFHERVCKTELLKGTNRELTSAFNHKCSVPMNQRKCPTLVDDQSLRNLRNKQGSKDNEGVVAYCPHCDEEFTYEYLVNGYVRKFGGLEYCKESPSDNTILPKARMVAHIVQYQRSLGVSMPDGLCVCINGNYNAHTSCHRPSCFKCTGKSKKVHQCGPKCECRYRLPDRPRQSAIVRTIHENKSWFDIHGNNNERPLVDFLPRRSKYDVFQNISCPAISETKLSCNSNAQVITDGPLGMYQFKYHLKNTQKDDVREYEEVERSMKSLSGRVHDDEKKEAVRLICRAAFAHNKSNIIGAPLASFLTRHDSRFYFSHEFVYCPLKDIVRLLNKERVNVTANIMQNCTFFENQALHYLCRPKELEEYCVFDFYPCMSPIPRVGGKKRKRDDDDERCIEFVKDTGHYQHPSALVDKKGNQQEPNQVCRIRPVDNDAYVKVSQWLFPDTGSFGCNILTCDDDKITTEMEMYAQHVLALFVPFRCREDLLPDGLPSRPYPYVRKYRELSSIDLQLESHGLKPRTFTSEVNTFLQNLQDCAYNSLRHKQGKDDLTSVTTPYVPEGMTLEQYGNEDDKDSDSDDDVDDPYQLIFESLNIQDPNDNDADVLFESMNNFSFECIRDYGRNDCGNTVDIPLLEYPMLTDADTSNFITSQMLVPVPETPARRNVDESRRTYMKKDIIKVVLQRSERTTRPSVFQYNSTAEVTAANGTVKSILEWASAANLDPLQKRAFECILAAFLLTFFDEVEDLTYSDGSQMTSETLTFNRARENLLKLKGDSDSQLICLLHGPGGSGKSTVILIVIAYAKEFCERMGHPFTSRTIVISAFTGVAAVLLHGETIHKALGLNMRSLQTEEGRAIIDAWQDTRLVIIDECSFGYEEVFNSIYTNLQIVHGKAFLPFGGQNIVYAGDFSQMEPPRRVPVYNMDPIPSFQGALSTFIELNGHHRFRKDPEWGERMARFREGAPTLNDIRTINRCCLVSESRKAPFGTQVACYRNKDRDAINTSIFENYCEMHKSNGIDTFNGACIIFMDDLEMSSSERVYSPLRSNAMKRHFWSSCGEDCVKFGDNSGERADPALKVFLNCPLMLTQNTDVCNGQANGSRVILLQIKTKPGEQCFPLRLQCGTIVPVYLACQIDYLVLQHEKEDIHPRTFKLQSKCLRFKASINIDGETNLVAMKGRQFPVVSNGATTGHKLQGYTAESLFANDWHYKVNWPYVVLSRTREMDGFYTREPLSEDLQKFAMNKNMKKMLQTFRDTILVRDIRDEEYSSMLSQEAHDISNTINVLESLLSLQNSNIQD